MLGHDFVIGYSNGSLKLDSNLIFFIFGFFLFLLLLLSYLQKLVGGEPVNVKIDVKGDQVEEKKAKDSHQ